MINRDTIIIVDMSENIMLQIIEAAENKKFRYLLHSCIFHRYLVPH